LAGEHPELDVEFRVADLQEAVLQMRAGEFDLVLGLSVFHHLCHELGQQAARDIVSSISGKAACAVFELALADEPVYWSSSLPKDPYWLLGGFAFVHAIARFPTHLSTVSRPLVFASARYWLLGDDFRAFDDWASASHEMADGSLGQTRRYYFAHGCLAKVYRFIEPSAAHNRSELHNEETFLGRRPTALPDAPRLVASGADEHEGWLVREMLPGELLSRRLAADPPVDARTIVLETLDQLAALEAAGLYHSDVRVWNILLGPDGRSHLIDYGAISAQPRDCAWPFNIHLSFFLFVRDLVTGRPAPPQPVRAPMLRPHDLPAPFGAWLGRLWQQPPSTWSFALFRAELLGVPEGAPAPDQRADSAADLWMDAIQTYLSLHLSLLSGSILPAQRQMQQDLQGLQRYVEHRERQLQAGLRPLRKVLSLYRRIRFFFR
jgi:O-antigen chain-terminating methyltransferase